MRTMNELLFCNFFFVNANRISKKKVYMMDRICSSVLMIPVVDTLRFKYHSLAQNSKLYAFYRMTCNKLIR